MSGNKAKTMEKVEELQKAIDYFNEHEGYDSINIDGLQVFVNEIKPLLSANEEVKEVRIITHKLGGNTVVDKVFTDKDEGLEYVRDMEAMCKRMKIKDISDHFIVDRELIWPEGEKDG